MPYDQLPWIGAAIAFAALALTIVSFRLDARAPVSAPAYVER
jgi:predicted MFS family arabinose efflux permease